jgi:hypothetical protein
MSMEESMDRLSASLDRLSTALEGKIEFIYTASQGATQPAPEAKVAKVDDAPAKEPAKKEKKEVKGKAKKGKAKKSAAPDPADLQARCLALVRSDKANSDKIKAAISTLGGKKIKDLDADGRVKLAIQIAEMESGD